MADHTSTQLPPALVDALREPASVSDRARRLDAIMTAVHDTAVHDAPAPSRALRHPPTRSRWRRGLLAPAGAAMVALMVTLWGGLASFTTVLERGATTMLARADVVGDTVVERLNAPRRDTVFATLYDTLRIVRFALRAPAASQVSLIEVAASARAGSTSTGTLIAAARQVADGLWELRTVVPRDAVARAYAFVIDESQQVPVPMGRTGWSSVGVHSGSRHIAAPAYPVQSDSAL